MHYAKASYHFDPPNAIRVDGEGWLDVERSVVAEVTSEEKDFPVELAFASRDTGGWRAVPGSQTIRLIFDQPQKLSCIFEENETGRTQEFVLRWLSNGESPLKEIVRQQWNFSPPESTREVEEYRVSLSNVTVLELIIKPNIAGGVARAPLQNSVYHDGERSLGEAFLRKELRHINSLRAGATRTRTRGLLP